MIRAVLRALMASNHAISLEDIIFHVRGQLSQEFISAESVQLTLAWLCGIGIVLQTSPAMFYLYDVQTSSKGHANAQPS